MEVDTEAIADENARVDAIGALVYSAELNEV
jgi:hypothetical protein